MSSHPPIDALFTIELGAMHSEKSRRKQKQGQVNEGSGSNLFEHCEIRKSQLEKILFAYQNLHRLPSIVAECAKNAFLTNNPLALWNFETEVLLSSNEIDEMMKQDRMQYSNYVVRPNMTPSDLGCFNRGNLISMLDAAYKPLPPPLMHPGATMSPPPIPQQFIPSPNPNIQGNFSPQFFGQMPAPGPMSPQMMGRTMLYQIAYPPAQGQPIPVSPQHHAGQPLPVPLMSFGQVGTGYQQYIACSPVSATCQPWMGTAPPPPTPPSNGTSSQPNSAPMPPLNLQNATKVSEEIDRSIPSPCIGPNTNNTSPNDIQSPAPIINDNHSETVTSKCLVPIAQNTSPSCSTSSHPPDRSDVDFSRMSDLVFDDRQKEHELDSISKTSHNKDELDDRNRGDLTPVEPREPDSGSVEDDSIPVASSSSITVPDVEGVLDLETINRSTTPTSEILKYVYPEDGVEEEWQVVSDKKSFAPMQALHDVTIRAEPKSTRNPVAIKEIVNDEEVPKEESSLPSENRKRRTTKKEKRIREEQKAKELETDDVILEQALQERLAYEEEAARTGVQTVVMNNSKKKRTRAQVIAENNLIANPSGQVEVPLNILHATRKTIETRAEKLEQFGLPTTSTNPERKEYYETLDLFVRTLARQASDLNTVLEFMFRRTAEFQRRPRTTNVVSRIIIYDQLFAAVPEAFMPELLFLSSLSRVSDDKFEKFEEIFFTLL